MKNNYDLYRISSSRNRSSNICFMEKNYRSIYGSTAGIKLFGKDLNKISSDLIFFEEILSFTDTENMQQKI